MLYLVYMYMLLLYMLERSTSRKVKAESVKAYWPLTIKNTLPTNTRILALDIEQVAQVEDT